MSRKIKFPGDFKTAFPDDLGNINEEDYISIIADDGKLNDGERTYG